LADSANLAVTATGGAFTLFVGAYTAWIGYRSKGKDLAHAQNTASYDNLQEDVQNLRIALQKAEERGDRYQAQLDACEQRRVDELAKFRDAMASDQFKRHELRSLVRSCLLVLDENHIPHEDMKRRAKALDKLP
jgi:DNA polymerase sigma